MPSFYDTVAIAVFLILVAVASITVYASVKLWDNGNRGWAIVLLGPVAVLLMMLNSHTGGTNPAYAQVIVLLLVVVGAFMELILPEDGYSTEDDTDELAEMPTEPVYYAPAVRLHKQVRVIRPARSFDQYA